jgi:hypothetical protein
MSIDANKALVRDSADEGWHKQCLATFDELLGPDLVNHRFPTGLPPTREGTKQLARLCWSAFSELHFTIADEVGEGDKVVTC